MKVKVAKIAHFSGHNAPVYAMAPSLHQNCFYSGAADGYVVEWDLAGNGDGRLIVNAGRPLYCIQVLKQSSQLLCGTASGHLHLVDLHVTGKSAGKEIRNIEAHTAGLFDMAATGNYLITAGGDGIVNIWETETLQLRHTFSGPVKSARVIAVSPDHKQFAVGFSDWHVRIYSLETFTLVHEIEAHTNSVFALQYAHDGLHLFSGGRDAMLKMWNASGNYELLKDLPAHTMQIKAIALNPAGNLFATVSMDKTIKIWDAQTVELLKVIDKARDNSHSNCINEVTWIDDMNFLTCSDDKTIIHWRLES